METKSFSAPSNAVDVEALKAKYGEVYQIAVQEIFVKHDPYLVPTNEDEDEIEGAVFAYIRKPTAKEINFAMSKVPNLIEAGKVIAKNCFVAGDRRVIDEPSMFTSAALQCIELLEIRQASLKKL
ncbi:hypothetical protein ACO2Q8_07770 [Larkinella sp. VNQ87]|uniref:hypothetical protein n=1 Tax=Larkinella sp. VNQ87 TaxID=3400921 RepID=UPI003C0D27F6